MKAFTQVSQLPGLKLMVSSPQAYTWTSVSTVLPLICRIAANQPEKAMAPHSSALAWSIPGTGEPGRLQSMGSRRVGHDWATSLSLFTFMHWRRKWEPTPVFFPGASQGQGSLVGCRPRGRTESATTKATQQQLSSQLAHLFQYRAFCHFLLNLASLNSVSIIA